MVVYSSGGGEGEDPESIGKITMVLDQIQADLEKEGIDGGVKQLARGFSPGEDIVMFAAENDIDQVYVGIHKKSRTSKLILGSTAPFIILKCKCPATPVNLN